MKFLITVCALSVLGLSVVECGVPHNLKYCDFSRGAYIDGNGRCVEACPEGSWSYTTGCGYKIAEATCEEPNPTTDYRGMICDFAACYCNSLTVRDRVSGKCVSLEECPKLNTIPL